MIPISRPLTWDLQRRFRLSNEDHPTLESATGIWFDHPILCETVYLGRLLIGRVICMDMRDMQFGALVRTWVPETHNV